jgi:hypothetical protein
LKLAIVKGTTSKSVDLFIRDSSVTTGAGLTGLVYNTASLTAYYHRQGSAATSISLATLASATASYSSGGFVVVDGTNMPGLYRFDVPDACLASGVDEVVIMLKGAANMEPVVLEIQLTSVNLNDAVRGGMTALPNANAEAAGGLFTRGTGAGQINQTVNGLSNSNLINIAGSAVSASTAQLGVNLVNIAGVAVSTTTAQLGVNVVSISGDSVAADNLEAYCDGTTPQPVNITHVISDPVQASSSKTTNWGGTP